MNNPRFEDSGYIGAISPSAPLIVTGGTFANNQTPVQKLEIKSSSDNLEPNDLVFSQRLKELYMPERKKVVYPLEFKECKECASKPGSPILCDSCLQNRSTISELEDTIPKGEDTVSDIDLRLEKLEKRVEELDAHMRKRFMEVEDTPVYQASCINGLTEANNILCDALGTLAAWTGLGETGFNQMTKLIDKARLKKDGYKLTDEEIDRLTKDDNNDTGEVKRTSLHMKGAKDDDTSDRRNSCDVVDSGRSVVGAAQRGATNGGGVEAVGSDSTGGDNGDGDTVDNEIMVCTKNGPVPSILNYDRGDVDDTVDEVMVELQSILCDALRVTGGDELGFYLAQMRPIVSKLVGEVSHDKKVVAYWFAKHEDLYQTFCDVVAERDAMKEDVKTQGAVWLEMQKRAQLAEVEASKWETTAMCEKSRREKAEAEVEKFKSTEIALTTLIKLQVGEITRLKAACDAWHKETLALRKSQEDSDKEFRKMKAERDAMQACVDVLRESPYEKINDWLGKRKQALAIFDAQKEVNDGTEI